MPQANVQFAVATHVMVALGCDDGAGVRSSELAASVNTDASFVRRTVSKLAKAGLVTTTRGAGGTCALARPASTITLLDIYHASEAPATCGVHGYPVAETCRVSRHIKPCLQNAIDDAQASFEQSLAGQSLAGLVLRVRRAR